MTAEQLAAATQAKVFLAIGSLVVDRASLQAQVEALTAALSTGQAPAVKGAGPTPLRHEQPAEDDSRRWARRVVEHDPLMNRMVNDGRGRAGDSASPVDGDER